MASDTSTMDSFVTTTPRRGPNRVRLTDGNRGTINRAAPADGSVLMLNDDLVPGFGLRITKTASTYVVVTRVRGRAGQIRRRLGTTRDTSLGEARAAARRLIEDAKSGIAPGDAAGAA